MQNLNKTSRANLKSQLGRRNVLLMLVLYKNKIPSTLKFMILTNTSTFNRNRMCIFSLCFIPLGMETEITTLQECQRGQEWETWDQDCRIEVSGVHLSPLVHQEYIDKWYNVHRAPDEQQRRNSDTVLSVDNKAEKGKKKKRRKRMEARPRKGTEGKESFPHLERPLSLMVRYSEIEKRF